MTSAFGNELRGRLVPRKCTFACALACHIGLAKYPF